MRSLLTTILAVVATTWAMTVEAQTDVPSDLELGASYCVGVGVVQDGPLTALYDTIVNDDPDCKKLSVPDYMPLCRQEHQLGRDAILAVERDAQRLRSYIIAKGYGTIPHKTLPELMAIKHGKADATDWKARTDNVAIQACTSYCLSDSDCSAQCTKQSDNDGLLARLGTCQGILQAIAG
jgi:hypothetical protein